MFSSIDNKLECRRVRRARIQSAKGKLTSQKSSVELKFALTGLTCATLGELRDQVGKVSRWNIGGRTVRDFVDGCMARDS
jgi:hypothetical protein